MLGGDAEDVIKGAFIGLAGIASSPGNQQFSKEPGRYWFRGVGMVGCETFGVPVEPGCLTKLLDATSRSNKAATAKKGTSSRDPKQTAAPIKDAVAKAGAGIDKAGADAKKAVKDTVDSISGTAGVATQSVKRLLDFLLGP
jgi:hypothetical protein